MSDYTFYVRLLRFVAAKVDRSEPRIAEMIALLEDLAAEAEARGAMTVAPAQVEQAARALAGVAGFLQQRILPEAVAHGNAAGEREIRWTVDASMEGVNHLLRVAAVEGGATGPVEIRLPPAP